MSEVTSQTTELLNADEVARTIACITHQIIEKTTLDSPNTRRVILLGIPSGDVPLAEKSTDLIEQFSGIRPETGSLDITLYEDDLHKGPHRTLQSTNVPNSGVDGTIVVLVDDVLFSGRTIRATLNATAGIGRPRAIQPAVLVDRSHRQLPVRADYVGESLPTSRNENVDVLVGTLDGHDAVILTRAEEQ